MRSALAILLSLSASSAFSADSEGRFAVDGVGNRTCQQFLDAVDENGNLAVAFAGWTSGFLTATNALRDDTFDLTPWQTVEVVMLKMRSYCTQNPEEIYMLGLGKLVSVLDQKRLKASDEIVRVETEGRAVFLYRTVLEDLRAALTERGYQLTQEEGVFDTSFSDALKSFQADSNIPQSGLPDQRTLVAVFDH